MDTPLIKIFDFCKFHQSVNQQDLFWNDPGFGVLSWILIALAIFIIGILLIFWIIKSVIKAGIKGLKATIKFIWKYCIWWWFKWVLLVAVICFIIILLIQGFGIWLTTDKYESFWWVFKWMAR